jgi:hypothetical protein
MTMDPHEKETTPNIPQAGGSQQSQPHAIFVSQEPGSKATVEITPDRRMWLAFQSTLMRSNTRSQAQHARLTGG